jgi:V8-like Glu-specific endopeptidase
MRRRSQRARPRVASPLAALLALLAALAACAGPAAASPAAAARAEARRTTDFWTPARMRAARPLDLVVGPGGSSRLHAGSPLEPTAGASYLPVATPEVAPFSVEGRVFFQRGDFLGFCSGTAINSPTRQLVLTAGHCVNSGREDGKPSVFSRHLEFVPAYTGGVAPFGTFAARPNAVHAPRPWIKQGNFDFDFGAFLTFPNSEGVNLADAVGGGATIVTDLDRHQTFQTFGYPRETKFMQTCTAPYIGDDASTNFLPGPPTMGVRCRWVPGASGGGWLIGDGTQIDGLNSYLHFSRNSPIFGPYFSATTVGRLVAGL